MIDAHNHLNDPRLLPQIEALLARMAEAGVRGGLVVGYDVPSSRTAVELARRYPGVLAAAVGVHPHEARDLDDAAFAELAELARAPETVALGEIGLDFHYDHSPRPVQRDAFRRQLALAAACELPIVIHEREAVEDVTAILDAEGGWARGGSWHCCSTDPETAVAIAAHFYVGIAGWITFPKADNIRALAAAVPLARLLVETDAPYIAPVPHRGRPNEPAYVRLTAEALAALKGVACDEVAARTAANTLAAFPRWAARLTP
jgi:TatD DNase family protein